MKRILLASVAACTLSGTAMAADTAESPFKAGDFMVRARVLDVMPQVSSHTSLGGDLSVTDGWTPEADFSYFFTPNISAELIAAVTKHQVNHSSGADVGNAWLLPPTLTLQYHCTHWADFLPYVGAGVNYTHFFDAKGGDLHSVKYDDSFGAAWQVGADMPLGGNWYGNVDVKQAFIHTTAKFSTGASADVNLDPIIVGFGAGYKF